MSTSFTDTSTSANNLNTAFTSLQTSCYDNGNGVDITDSNTYGNSAIDSATYSGYITSFADSCEGISDILDQLPDPLNKVCKHIDASTHLLIYLLLIY